MPRRLAFASLGLLIVTATMAQLPGGSGGPGGQGPGQGATDSSPWNPANYQITKVLSGEDTVSSWIMLSGSPTLSVLVYPWVIAGQIGPEPMGAVNSTPSVRTSTMVSEGEATIQVQWIGVGPAPTKVLLRIHSGTFAGTTPAGIMEVDNGIGSPIQWSEEPSVYQSYKQQTEFKDRYVQLDGGGYGELRIDKRASASVTAAPGLIAYATARGINAYVAERAVTLTGQPNPTYRLGSTFHPTYGWLPAPVANENDDPKDIVMDIAPAETQDASNYIATAIVQASLWGPWAEPRWNWTGVQSNSLSYQFTQSFTRNEIGGIAVGGPIEFQTFFSATDDADSFADFAKVTYRIHAPWESPKWLMNEQIFGEWVAITLVGITDPLATMQLTYTSEGSTQVTKQLNIGASGETLTKAHPLVQLLGIDAQYGETAVVTRNTSVSYSVPPQNPRRRKQVYKRPFKRKLTGHYHAFGPNGYQGLANMELITWWSGSREQAELVDAEVELRDLGLAQ